VSNGGRLNGTSDTASNDMAGPAVTVGSFVEGGFSMSVIPLVPVVSCGLELAGTLANSPSVVPFPLAFGRRLVELRSRGDPVAFPLGAWVLFALVFVLALLALALPALLVFLEPLRLVELRAGGGVRMACPSTA
jgi:hypothetical protein